LLSTGAVQLGILGKGPGDAAERDLSCLDSGRVAGISNDGRVIVANIVGESATSKGSIYMRKTDGSPAARVGDGHAYKLSPDGKQLLGPKANGGWIVYSVDGAAPRDALGIEPNEFPMGWRSDNRSAFVRPNRESTASIPVAVVDIVTGKRSAWKEIRPAQPVVEIHDLYITPDGAGYAYNFVLIQSDLYVAKGLQ
ncbi:MAG TPA: hypothetical protein VIX89_15625, partial [Bryobacteraceae bacterium]